MATLRTNKSLMDGRKKNPRLLREIRNSIEDNLPSAPPARRVRCRSNSLQDICWPTSKRKVIVVHPDTALGSSEKLSSNIDTPSTSRPAEPSSSTSGRWRPPPKVLKKSQEKILKSQNMKTGKIFKKKERKDAGAATRPKGKSYKTRSDRNIKEKELTDEVRISTRLIPQRSSLE